MQKRLEILKNFTAFLKAELLNLSYEDKHIEAIHEKCFDLECVINERINSIRRKISPAGNGATQTKEV